MTKEIEKQLLKVLSLVSEVEKSKNLTLMRQALRLLTAFRGLKESVK